MSRVWKQFLKQMTWPICSLFAYVVFALIGGWASVQLGYPWEVGFFGVPGTMMLFSLAGAMVYIEWDRARNTVQRENVSLMRAMKDD